MKITCTIDILLITYKTNDVPSYKSSKLLIEIKLKPNESIQNCYKKFTFTIFHPFLYQLIYVD